jgi:hypothetical protein
MARKIKDFFSGTVGPVVIYERNVGAKRYVGNV